MRGEPLIEALLTLIKKKRSYHDVPLIHCKPQEQEKEVQHSSFCQSCDNSTMCTPPSVRLATLVISCRFWCMLPAVPGYPLPVSFLY